jgi:DNA (cytosine-5)-methyltransferase 1
MARDKIKKKHSREQPTMISLFGGCGGSSLGYQMAGFRELLFVEWDLRMARVFERNIPAVPIVCDDITTVDVTYCMQRAGVDYRELDLLDGSPPCQGFSTAGARRIDDPRNSLFMHYARFVKELQPKTFVMENVSGLVKGDMGRIYLTMKSTLSGLGYQVSGRQLNAKFYGVPQSRARVFLIGVRNDLGMSPSHPKKQTEPITVQQAWQGLKDPGAVRRITPLHALRWSEISPGESHPREFGIIRLAWDGVAPTVVRNCRHLHPDTPRHCGVNELKRLFSFPDDFQFNSWKEAANGLGNCVPPLLIKAIAEHIKFTILEKIT